MIFKTPPDGACGAHALATHIFNSEGHGRNLRKNINTCLQSQWSFYKDKVCFPYIRNVGTNGRMVSFNNSGELFNFFETDGDSDILWLDSEDFKVVSNLYQVKIKIISYQTKFDKNPTVSMIAPTEVHTRRKHLLSFSIVETCSFFGVFVCLINI